MVTLNVMACPQEQLFPVQFLNSCSLTKLSFFLLKVMRHKQLIMLMRNQNLNHNHVSLQKRTIVLTICFTLLINSTFLIHLVLDY